MSYYTSPPDTPGTFDSKGMYPRVPLLSRVHERKSLTPACTHCVPLGWECQIAFASKAVFPAEIANRALR